MKSRKRKVFAGAVVTVGLLALLPPTGWIVRQQFRLISGQPLPGLRGLMSTSSHWTNPEIDPREQSAAAAHPDDFDDQVALAVQQADEQGASKGALSPVVRALLDLRSRFNDRPELSAHILRYLTMGELKIARDQDELILDSHPPRADAAKSAAEAQAKVPNAATITLALEAAQRGEALDPTNAFFTAMRATALAGARRDAEALDAWKAAGNKPMWDDYATEEIRGRWNLLHDAQGETSEISREVIAASLLFPHYARLRDMARFATSCAIRQELVGDAAGGFANRQATARVGALMRAQSKPIIGNLVGIAMTQIATKRPGGALSPTFRADDHDQAERQAQYIVYLAHQGHPEEARWFVAETQAGTKVRSISSTGLSALEGYTDPTLKTMCWWIIGILLLLTTFWTLTLGGVAALLARGKQIRGGEPLRYPVRFSGFAAAAALTAIAAYGMELLLDERNDQAPYAVAAAGVVFFFAGFVARLKHGRTWGGVGSDIVKGFAALVLTVGALALLIGLAARMSVGAVQIGSVFSILLGMGEVDGAPGYGLYLMPGADFGIVTLAVPLMAMLALAVRSRIRRVPVSVGLVRGMRGFALPAAATLLLLYAAVLVGTRRQEGIAHKFVAATAANEGPFYAGETHQTWPGKTTLDAPAPPKMTGDSSDY